MFEARHGSAKLLLVRCSRYFSWSTALVGEVFEVLRQFLALVGEVFEAHFDLHALVGEVFEVFDPETSSCW